MNDLLALRTAQLGLIA